MQAQCSPIDMSGWTVAHCLAIRPLPSSWFEIGTTSYSTNFGPILFDQTSYYHHTNANKDGCLPCCVSRSNNPKMPSEI